MKKILVLCLIAISFGFYKVDVEAASTPVYCEHSLASACSNPSAEYTERKSLYDEGIPSFNISGSDTITIYGRSVCNGTSCTLTYTEGIKDFKEVIAKSVTCSGGEDYVIYQEAGSGKNSYTESNTNKLTGTAYWDEDSLITCTSTNSGGNTTITLGNTSSGGNSGGSSTGGTSTGSTNTGSNGTGDSYNSSSTVTNPEQGVTTYFVVLGVVALISYVAMIFIKKYNLFKNI